MASMTDADLVKWIIACRDEAEEAKTKRMARNKENFDMFHLEYDFSAKNKGQSQEVLSKQSMAVEQIRSFFQQALVDIGDWWSAEAQDPSSAEGMSIRPEEITKLTNHFLEQATYYSHVGNCVQSALLASLGISKTYGCLKAKPKYVVEEKGRGKKYRKVLKKIDEKAWNLKFDVVRAENYYPDPTGKNLYEIEEMWPDMHEVVALAEGDEAIYDSSKVAGLSPASTEDAENEADKARETGQNTTNGGHRPKVKITEYWGTVLDSEGKVCYENHVITMANDTVILRKDPNPLWHQGRPYSASPLTEVANSVWHKALMDAPSQHNRALIEMYNLMVDAGMMEVHGIKQLRKNNLDNVAQVADGIRPGTTLVVNSGLPIGGKVLEPLTAVTIPQDAFNIFNLMNQEFNASALTNDLRQGVMPFRAVKATEVVEASQTITSVFQGIAKNYEAKQIQRELELSWQTTAQNWNRIDPEVFKSLFGAQRGEEMSQMSPEDVFAATVNGIKFRVYGISMTLSKGQNYQKLTQMLQVISASPALMEEFVKKYDLGKTLGEILTALDIDKYKLEIPKAVQMTMEPQPEGQPEQGGPDSMSQVPNPLQDMMAGQGSNIPQTEFPGSPALAGGNPV